MEANGYPVEEKNVADSVAVKLDHSVPQELYSCHTAVVDGYTIEGHVPAAEIDRLLAERPDIAGLAVAGMPIGSPGMDGAAYGGRRDKYDTLLVLRDGSSRVFQSHS